LTAQTFHGFLLTRNWRDTANGVELEFWFSTDNGPLCALVRGERSVFFLPEPDIEQAKKLLVGLAPEEIRPVSLRDFDMQPVVALYFKHHRDARRAARLLREHDLDPLESDINPAERFLMERFVRGAAELQGVARQRGNFSVVENPSIKSGQYQPQLRVVSFDIETAMEGVQLYSIAVHGRDGPNEERQVFMLGDGAEQPWVTAYPSQEKVLQAFLDWLEVFDPDVLIGWNVVNFDARYLQRLCDQLGCRLLLGRNRRAAHWRELDDDGTRFAVQAPGRVLLDGIELLRAAFYSFESFSLENVARELLGEGKLLHGGNRGDEITRQFLEDKTSLAAYNLKDCELVSDIFEHTSLLDFAVARSLMTGLNIDRLGGSVAAFDNLYLPRLHRKGFVAPNASTEHIASPGGFVLDSTPGIFDHVLVLDFKSLYPSIIRTFCIDPLGLAQGLRGDLPAEGKVEGFIGAEFSRESPILPELIAQLWAQRDQAKAERDEPLSQAIKIIMNSFYGVLGTPGCRFFDARLASSITRRGHEILGATRDYLEDAGHKVIYGDTDSVFVWIQGAASDAEAEDIGRGLEADLNRWWRESIEEKFQLSSVLEVEFETHYKRFLMPTIRGSDKGSKKRYAGVVATNGGEKLVFKGLENVRTDWTRLARDFQEELYRRVFYGEPFKDYVKALMEKVVLGELDDQLVYRKRLRRRLDDYERNVPPHVQAARLYKERGLAAITRGDWVEYVITTSGAEPAAKQLAPLDYQHYVDRQLAPVADGILGFVGTSFSALTDRQIDLF
jgi:DNA polymerase II